MASLSNIRIEPELRLCTVKGELGFFHCWEHYSRPVAASPLIGGEPAGIHSEVFGIVEFTDGVRRVRPYLIMFCDEKNGILNAMNKHEEGELDG